MLAKRIIENDARKIMSEVSSDVRYLVACALAELDDSLTNHEEETLAKYGNALKLYIETRKVS